MEKPFRKIDVYVCPHGHETVTVQTVKGMTAGSIKCPAKLIDNSFCNNSATSSNNECDQFLIPEYEWYAAPLKENASRIEKEYFEEGGLYIRPVISVRGVKVDAKTRLNDIVQLMANGMSAKQIAPELNLSIRTVEQLIGKAKSLAGAATIAELIAKYFRANLIK